MDSTAAQKRRQLKFNSLDEIVQDAARWEAEQYEPIGNWSCGQILRHLANTMNGAIDGFGFRASWMIRVVAPWLKQSVMTKSMRPGFQLPKRAKSLLPADNVSTAQGLVELKAALARYSRESPTAPHPAFGPMTPNEWTQLHCRHAELHMSFAVPARTQETPDGIERRRC